MGGGPRRRALLERNARPLAPAPLHPLSPRTSNARRAFAHRHLSKNRPDADAHTGYADKSEDDRQDDQPARQLLEAHLEID